MQQKVNIYFKIKEHGMWKLIHSLPVNPSNIVELQRLIKKYIRKKDPIYPYTKDIRIVKVGIYFKDTITDGENILYLILAGRDTDSSESYTAQPPKKIQ
jgi:hypothetical protein